MRLAEIQQTLQTVIAIPVTPFAADGSVDYETYTRLVARMIHNGISVVTPNGNTGEFYSLTADEQRRIVDATAEAAGDRALILAGVGYDAHTADDMARYAASRGAQAVMVHQPVHPYKSDEGWLAYHRTIAEAVPDVAVVPYLRDATLQPATL